MTEHTAAPGTGQAFVEMRRARLLAGLDGGRQPAAAGTTPLPRERLNYLLHEAEDLFWNELAWEELTEEERIAGGHLTELVFPGFLAFVSGLLIEEVPADSLAPAQPHPDAVEEVLSFLGDRYVEFTGRIEAGADSEKLIWARKMAAELIDLVLYRLYQVTSPERERLEGGA